MRTLLIVLGSAAFLANIVHAVPVQVTATGSVVFNGIATPPLNAVGAGQQATMSFLVDSDVFTDGIPGDTRGYEIDHGSFSLAFSGGVEVGLLTPFPGGQVPYFTIVDGFPVSDGFFVATSNVSPGGVPLSQTPLQATLDLGYQGSTLGSLDILAAQGVYGFGGLTRFSFGIWQIFPDNIVMEIDFEELEIALPVSVDGSTWGGIKALYR